MENALLSRSYLVKNKVNSFKATKGTPFFSDFKRKKYSCRVPKCFVGEFSSILMRISVFQWETKIVSLSNSNFPVKTVLKIDNLFDMLERKLIFLVVGFETFTGEFRVSYSRVQSFSTIRNVSFETSNFAFENFKFLMGNLYFCNGNFEFSAREFQVSVSKPQFFVRKAAIFRRS